MKLEQIDTSTTAGKLLPCPFCGGEPRISDLPESAIHVACKCGVNMFGARSHHSSHEEAIYHWNRRADLAGEKG